LSVNSVARRLIKAHEGLRLTPYRCTEGYLTIGYGRNLETTGISRGEAEAMLDSDIDEAHRSLSFLDFWSDLNDARKAALIDMAFNLGITGLMTFKKMLAALERKDYDAASSEILDSRYAIQVGARAIRIATIIRSGVSPSNHH